MSNPSEPKPVRNPRMKKLREQLKLALREDKRIQSSPAVREAKRHMSRDLDEFA
jgi:hypothetical protein